MPGADAPADGVTGGEAFQAALATALFAGARRAACLEGQAVVPHMMV